MKTNESNVDRILRVLVGMVLYALYFTGIVSGGFGIAFIVLGAIGIITGAFGFCPLYALLKVSTIKS